MILVGSFYTCMFMISTGSVLHSAFILRITTYLAKHIETCMLVIAYLISKGFSIILFEQLIYGLHH